MKYVLIGGSIACYGAIIGIKSLDKNADITVFGDENSPLYSRPLISYFLEGKTSKENLAFRGADFYCKNGVNNISYKITEINPESKTVKAENGKNYPYDKLFFGTGSRPFVPPIQGLEKVKNKTCFYTADDAFRLKKTLNADSRLLIVGAGLIGLKCAEGCYHITKNITVIDLQTRVLPTATTPKVARILENVLTEKGITQRLGVSVNSFEENSAVLSTGEKIPFDVVVLAMGVRPVTEPLASAGALTSRGIIVDEYMRTSVPDVFSAGDCAESYDAVSGEKRLLQLFPSAYNGGLIAGKNMTGANESFLTDVALNSTSFFGLRFTSCGSYDGELIETENGTDYKALYIKNGLFNGYILVGNTDCAGIYTNIISHRIPLKDTDNKLLFGSPSLAVYDVATRNKLLSEKV